MIVLDTSAILAILFLGWRGRLVPRPDQAGRAGGVSVSAGTAVEFAAVASRDGDPFTAIRAFLDEQFISVEPLDAAQAVIAGGGGAYRRYCKGHHPAGLNLGGVFAYALAHERELPLLFKGKDFSRTDIKEPKRNGFPTELVACCTKIEPIWSMASNTADGQGGSSSKCAKVAWTRCTPQFPTMATFAML